MQCARRYCQVVDVRLQGICIDMYSLSFPQCKARHNRRHFHRCDIAGSLSLNNLAIPIGTVRCRQGEASAPSTKP